EPRRHAPAARVEAPCGPPARVGRAGERTQAGVGAGPAVLHVGAGDIEHCSRAVAFLPLLLVAGAAERGVERAEARERRAADGHVRAPRKTRGGIVLALVERRDRRLLAPAAVGGGTLEAGGD